MPHGDRSRRIRGVWSVAVALSVLLLPAGGAAGKDAKPAGNFKINWKARIEPRLLTNVTSAGRIQLRWRVHRWRDKQVGFWLFRKEVSDTSGGGNWVLVRDRAITPHNPEITKELERKGVLKRKDETDDDGPTLHTLLKRFRAREGLGFRRYQMAASMEFEMARAFGFGLIDADVEAGGTYRYGIAQAFEGRRADAKDIFATAELTVRQGDFRLPPLVGLECSRAFQSDRADLTWAIRREDLHRHGNVRSFAIYKGPPNGPLTKVAQRLWVGLGSKDDDGLVRFSWHDLEADDARSFKYALAPINYFKTEGMISPERAVVLPKGPETPKPRVARPELTKEGVVVRWRYVHPDSVPPLEGFRVFRHVTGDKAGWIEATSQPLPHWRRSFLDEGAFDDEYLGRQLTYRVTAIGKGERGDGESYMSLNVAIPNAPNSPAPQPPSEFSAEGYIRDGEHYVRLSWTPSDSEHVVGYTFWKRDGRTGVWRPIGDSGPTDSAEREVHPIWDELTICCRARSADGQRSEPTEPVRVPWPPVRSPEVPAHRDLRVRRKTVARKTRRVEFDWTQFYPTTVGTRLLVDGKVIADEYMLGDDVERWRSWTVPDGRHEFAWAVVDEYGRVSEPSEPLTETIGEQPEPRKPLDGPNKTVLHEDGRIEVKTYYSEKKAQVRSVFHYIRDELGRAIRHGPCVSYHRNGKTDWRGQYVDGQKDGPLFMYWSDGSLRTISFHIDGRQVLYGEYVEKRQEPELTKQQKQWLEEHKN